MDCYSCIYRRDLPGSTHSTCGVFDNTPALGLEMLLTIMTNDISWFKDIIDIDPHGIKKGWANYPFNFDPIWIKSCKFYRAISPKE